MRVSLGILGLLALAACQTDKDTDGTDTDTDPDVVDSIDDSEVIDSDTDGDTLVESDTIDETDTLVESDTIVESDTDTPTLTVADLSPGDLFVTEVMVDPTNCSDALGEYVEVVYDGPDRVDLAGLRVVGRNSQTAQLPSVVLSPGQRVLVGHSLGLCGAWGAPADFAWTGLSLDATNERVQLRTPGGVTLSEVSLAGRAANPGFAWSLDEVTGAWCDATSTLPGSPADHGTPGAANDACPDDTDTVVVDTLVESDTVVVDTVVIDTEPVILTLDELVPGDLRVTEIGSWPLLCGGDAGKFVEIQNRTANPVNLNGLWFGVDSASTPQRQQFAYDLFVPAGGFLIVTRNQTLFEGCYGSTTARLAFALVRLADTDDRVILSRTDGTVLADADYPFADGPITRGRSKERDESDVWCDAVEQRMGRDYATPGVATVPCDARGDTDTLVVDTLVTDSDTQVAVETGVDTFVGPELTMADLRRGDLQLTEIMATPQACNDDDRSEYFEALYVGAARVDLYGLRISTRNGGTLDMMRHVHVDPGERVVFARDPAAFEACYGFAPTVGTRLLLADDSDILELRAVFPGGSRVIDDTFFTANTLPPGTALERDDLDPNAWCTADTRIGTLNDYGSPGAPNGACPVIGGDTFRVDTAGPDPIPPRTLAQRLLITEVADRTVEPVLRWVEITNPGPGTVSLDGWFIGRYSNGGRLGLTVEKAPLRSDVVLPPGESWMVGRLSAATAWITEFGREPDQYDPRIAGNGNDVYTLEYRGVLVDIFGQIGVDGFGTDWDYANKVALRHGDVREPRTRWTRSEWTFSTTYADSTPSEHTFTVPPSLDTATPAPGAPLRVWDVTPGELLISEFMPDPVTCADQLAEYVELVWLGASDLELRGLTLRIGVVSTTIAEPWVVSPGGRVILARDFAGYASCYGAPPDLELALAMKATGDVFRLIDPTGRELDRVDDTTWTIAPGVAFERDDVETFLWCSATTPIASTSDLGSPGLANGACAP